MSRLTAKPTNNKYKNTRSGFTLVEACMALLIGGVGLTALGLTFNNYMKNLRAKTTLTRMQAIDKAIVSYLNTNGALPCVARLNDTTDSSTFGRQLPVSAISDCYTLSASTPGTFRAEGRHPPLSPPSVNAVPGLIVIGAVPVRTLNLPDQYMADAWGNRFVYAVTDALTIASTVAMPLNGYNPTQGAIYVRDSAGAAVATPDGSAQYVLVSYGPDKAGGYALAGGGNGVACPTGALQSPNCTLPTSTFVKSLMTSTQAGATAYDDYVSFRTQTTSTGTVPTGMVAPFMLAACPPGWGPFTGTPACPSYTAYSTTSICCLKLN